MAEDSAPGPLLDRIAWTVDYCGALSPRTLAHALGVTEAEVIDTADAGSRGPLRKVRRYYQKGRVWYGRA